MHAWPPAPRSSSTPRAPQILESAEATAEFAYVVRRGSVELIVDGHLLDLMEEGEMFGFVSLLSEGPLGFVARAAEDTLVYRIPADVIRPVLEQPASVRFMVQRMDKRVRLLAGHESESPLSAAGRPVGELIRAPALVCPPETSVREAARRMAEAGATCVVVEPRRPPRDRHGPRHPHPCGGRGRGSEDAAVRRDDRAGVDGVRRPHGHGRAARDARPRHPPPAGAQRQKEAARRAGRRGPDGERAARAVSPAGVDRTRRRRGGGGARPPPSCPTR